MSGRRKEREVYVSEPSSSPQFQQQRPPLFPKALPIFHQNRILNSSNFEHEMPGEGIYASVKLRSRFVRLSILLNPSFSLMGFVYTYNIEFRGVD
ncbi:uncharacterized protein [Malus domestica]|uniref:uncharacterized protein isoform X3 n=1 Tax=Malus domestica TaxID=3750 RepID=UPI0039771842